MLELDGLLALLVLGIRCISRTVVSIVRVGVSCIRSTVIIVSVGVSRSVLVVSVVWLVLSVLRC